MSCGEHSSHKKLFESQLSDCPYCFYVCNFARPQDCSLSYHEWTRYCFISFIHLSCACCYVFASLSGWSIIKQGSFYLVHRQNDNILDKSFGQSLITQKHSFNIPSFLGLTIWNKQSCMRYLRLQKKRYINDWGVPDEAFAIGLYCFDTIVTASKWFMKL